MAEMNGLVCRGLVGVPVVSMAVLCIVQLG